MHRRVAATAALLVLSALVLGCATPTPPAPTPRASTAPPVAGVSAPPPTTGPTAPPVQAPSLTPVPGGETPEPPATRIPTTQTDWGEILDGVPDSFPFYRDPGIVDVDEPASVSFTAPDDVETVATWYRRVLADRGWSVDVGNALEDGSRVLDATSDLPECRLRMTFRPAPDSTIITVLYAAACAGAGG